MGYRFHIGLLFVLMPIFVYGDFSTRANQALRCMFMNTLPSPCHTDEGSKIPLNLVKTFNDLPQSIQVSLENGELDNLTDTEFASLPTVFLSLLPVDRLSKLSVSKLVRVIATHPNEVSLAVHMVSAVKTSQQKLVFIEQIRDVNTSTEVQRVLAEAIIEMDLSNITQLPFLLHMPPRYLLQLNNSEVHQIYNHLPTQATNLTPLEIRIWASLSLNERFSLKQFDWLLTGFTEEELGNISNTPDKFNIDFSIVQARAVFEKFYENKVLTRINIAESASLLSKLTPSMLQRFPQALQDYYSEIKHLSSPFSVATAKQIMEFIIATSLERNKLGMNRSMWRERIQYLNKWVYVLPPSVLKQYARFTTLTPTILNKIQSEMLTNVQAYYLTNKGLSMNLSIPSSIMTNKDHLLSALPTTQLLEHPMGSFQSTVLEHILVHLPDKNVPRMVSLLAKIFTSFDSDEEFCNLLENKAVNAYFNLISSSIIQQSSDDILLKIWKLKYSHLPIIQQLPPRILSILLRSAKQDDTWTWENFINSSQPLYVLINGINCDHVLNIATTDFITIMAYYNQKRENFKKVFPKNLQYCCLQKLMEYLQLKMELQHTNLDEGIISLLGPMEIEAIGGYVLLGLPTEAIKENKHTKHILAAIGKLSVAELLIATNLPKLKELALLAIRYMFTPTFADYFELGNLLWFVNPTLLPANTTATLKLAIESQILDKRLCLNAEERNALATFLIQMYGPPESWSRGKLAILGDLLLVFPEEILLKVNETSWVDAADTLHSNYYDIVEWTQPTPFYKVCMVVLEQIEKEAYLSDVKRLVRWRLRAAERQLSTVYIAFNESNTESNKIHRPISKIQSDTRIKVYSFSEEEEEEEYSTTEDYSAEYDPDTTETTDMNDFSTKESTTEISTTETEKYSSNNIKEDKTTEAIQNKTTKSTRDITKTIDVYDQTTKVFSQGTMNTFTTDTIKLSSIETPSTNKTNIEQSITIEISTKTMDTDLLKTIIAQSDIEPTSTIKDSITQHHKVDQYLSTITKTTTKVPETNRKIMLFLNNTENSTDTTHIINMTKPNSDRLKNISTNFATEKNFHLSVNEGVTETVPNNKTKIFTNMMENESERIKTVTMSSNNRETSTVVIENKERDLELNTSQSLITTRLPVITDATTVQLLNLSTTVKMNLTHIDNKITENITTEVVEEVSGELVPEPHDSILEKIEKTRTRRSVFINWSSIKFSCDAVKMVGDIAALSLSSEDIDNMEHSELIDCGETLGRLDLPEDVLTNIWSRLDEREPIHLMGNLLKAIKFVDVFNMKMNPSVPWILETISAFSQHITDSYLIGIVIEDFKNRNDLEVINVETLAALNSLICLLDIEKIPNIRQRFHNITVLLGTSAGCPTCVSKLAEIVVSPDGFGNIDRWEVEDVETMGSIIAGLNDTQWNDLLQSPKHLLSGLQPNAIRCLSSKQLKMIPKDMFSLIPPLTLAGISEEKLSQLSLEQTSIIQDVKNLKIWTDILPKKKKNILVAGYPMSSSSTMHEVSFVYLTFLIISAFVFI